MSTPEAPRRLVVLSPNWLGDAVMALPLLADLRCAWPKTEIVVAARRAVAPLFAMVPGVSDTLALDGGGGPSALATAQRNSAALRGGDFDVALLLPNSFIAAWLVWRAGIAERWGYRRDMRGRLLTRALPRPAKYGHQVEYYQAIAAGLGVPVGERFASLTVSIDGHTHAATLLRGSGVGEGQRYAAFAPGAAYGRAKQWLPERFAELAQLLDADGVATVVVGAKSDASACDEVVRLSRRKTPPVSVINFSGRTDLATLAGLFTQAAAVVTNDSGAMHLAAAVGARLTAVFGPTDDSRTSPLPTGPGAPVPRIVASKVWCRPCMLRECPIDHRCMREITAEQVFAEMIA